MTFPDLVGKDEILLQVEESYCKRYIANLVASDARGGRNNGTPALGEPGLPQHSSLRPIAPL